jgi:hypothetical protein
MLFEETLRRTRRGGTSATTTNPTRKRRPRKLAPHATLNASAKKSRADEEMGREYIENLQQQVYLLELEADVLKSGGGGVTGNTSGESSSNSAASSSKAHRAQTRRPLPVARQHAPLSTYEGHDDIVSALRIKYRIMEEQYQADISVSSSPHTRTHTHTVSSYSISSLVGILTFSTQSAPTATAPCISGV